jgi:hypothetical protein
MFKFASKIFAIFEHIFERLFEHHYLNASSGLIRPTLPQRRCIKKRLDNSDSLAWTSGLIFCAAINDRVTTRVDQPMGGILISNRAQVSPNQFSWMLRVECWSIRPGIFHSIPPSLQVVECARLRVKE